MEFTKNEKLAILKNLELVIMADNVFHDKEKEFLLAVLIKFNMTISEAQGIKNIELVLS